MTLKNAIKKLEAKGLLVVQRSNNVLNVQANGYSLTIMGQGEDVATMRVRRFNDEDDSQSDYSAGSFWDTMPQVFRAMELQK